jgi:hypothetical protein
MNTVLRFSFQEAIGEKLVVNKREIIEVQGSIFLRGNGQSRGHPGTLNKETQKYKDKIRRYCHGRQKGYY